MHCATLPAAMGFSRVAQALGGGRRVGEPAMVARQFLVTYSEQPSRQTDADHGIYRECFDEADVIAHLAANVIKVG